MTETLEGPIINVTEHDDGSMSAVLTEVGRAVVEYIEQEFSRGRDIEDIGRELNHNVVELRILMTLATLTEDKERENSL